MMIKIRRLIAAVLIATVLGTGIPNPPEARADDTAWIVIGSIVGYFGVILLATWWLRSRDSGFDQSSVSPLVPLDQLPERQVENRGPVRVAHECGVRPGESLPLLCW